MTQGWPLAAVWAFFLFGAIARGGVLYWIGRGVRRADRRLADLSAIKKAEEVVTRWGAPVVTLSFLTVGVQSAVNIAAGLLHMPARRFVPALVLGGALWATIYTTVGMAVFYAFLGEYSWWLVLAAVAGTVAIVAGTAYARRRLQLRSPGEEVPAEDSVH